MPEGAPTAAIAFFHGGGGHSGQPTYSYFTKYFAEKGYAVYGLDQRGFGCSEGVTYHIDKIQDVREDIRGFIEVVQEMGNGEPVFGLEQSLGGTFLLEYCLHYPNGVFGAVAVASALSFDKLSPAFRLVVRLISRIVPKKVVNPNIDVTVLSRDPKEVARMKADELSSLASTTRGAVQALGMADWVHENAPKFKTPLLVIHGKDDRLSPYTASEKFFYNVTFEDKTLKLYPKTCQQPFIDINREEVFSDIEQWFEAHL